MKVKFLKGFASIILEIAIIAVLLGAFIYASPKFKNSPQPTPSPTVSPSPISTTETVYTDGGSANWKIYIDKNRKFSFKYPENYFVTEKNNGNIILGFSNNNPSEILKILYLTSNPSKFINYSSYELCSPGKDHVPDYPCVSEWNSAVLTLNGKSISKFQFSEGIDDGYAVVQTKDSPKIELKMSIAGGGLEYTFNQILSTFKFLDQNLTNETSKSCQQDADCTLLLCGGCFNKEWAETAPADLPCARYEGYSCSCTNSSCTEVK